MSEKYSFIVVKYPQKETGGAALPVVKELAKEKIVKLKDAVAITKTEKGKIKLQQTKDDPASKGFLKGGVIGIIFAVLLRWSCLDRRWCAHGHCVFLVRSRHKEQVTEGTWRKHDCRRIGPGGAG